MKFVATMEGDKKYMFSAFVAIMISNAEVVHAGCVEVVLGSRIFTASSS